MTETGPGELSELDAGRRGIHRTTLCNGKEAVLLNVSPLPISATAIRRLVKEKKSIKYLLPEPVESYIISHSLYQEGSEHL
jgi:nicotinic acid mononucleotide adenylyltransferase